MSLPPSSAAGATLGSVGPAACVPYLVAGIAGRE